MIRETTIYYKDNIKCQLFWHFDSENVINNLKAMLFVADNFHLS